MSKKPLWWQLGFSKPHIALGRMVSYGGMFEIVFFEEYKKLCAEFGQEKVAAAVQEILIIDKATLPAIVRLTAEARKACWQLLGPQPEHPIYEDYWKGRKKPAAHQPPPLPLASEASKIPTGPVAATPPEPDVKPPEVTKPRRTKKEEPQEEGTPRRATEGLSPESYAEEAKVKNRRALMCMLRDARKKLAHHGRRSFMGREAKKEIAAAEAEIKNRGYTVPAEGEETKEWDRKKTG